MAFPGAFSDDIGDPINAIPSCVARAKPWKHFDYLMESKNAMMDLQALTIHPQRFVPPKRVRLAPVWADRAKRYSLGTVWETRRSGK